MRRVCCVCKKFFGFKEPLDDDSETHGFCPECFDLERAKIAAYLESHPGPLEDLEPKP